MKVRIELESNEDIDKVVLDFKYRQPKVIVKEIKSNDVNQSVTIVEEPKIEKPIKSHGFDANMMDIVNA